MSLQLLADALAKAPTYQPADPATYWVPLLGVLVVGALGFLGALYAANRAGSNSDKALVRTIEADREGRILERRLDLYGDLLTFAAKRKQHRDVTMTFASIDGWTALDPFKPEQVFEIGGRTRAIADAAVYAAWVAADEADMASIRSWNLIQFAKGDPNGAVERVEKSFANKEAADLADTALEAAVRKALHEEE